MAERIQRYRVIMEVRLPPGSVHNSFCTPFQPLLLSASGTETRILVPVSADAPRYAVMTIWSISPSCTSALDKRSSSSDRSSTTVPKCVIHGVDCPSRRSPLGTRGTESQIQSACGRDEGPLCPRLMITIMFKIHQYISLARVVFYFFLCNLFSIWQSFIEYITQFGHEDRFERVVQVLRKKRAVGFGHRAIKSFGSSMCDEKESGILRVVPNAPP